jgi:phosphohistidine phosphatase
MKKVILVRHAKAIGREEGLPDFVRSLVKKGKKQAKNMSKKLKNQLVTPPDLFISSPANRTLETAHVFAKELNYPAKKIMLKDELYNELTTQSFLDMLKNLDNNAASVIIFGHDPSMSEFAQYLARDFRESLPKCATVVMSFHKNGWKDIAKGQGEVEYFEYPKRLVKFYRTQKEELAEKLQTQIVKVLKLFDADVTEKKIKSVRKWTGEMADKFVTAVKNYRMKKDDTGPEGKTQKKDETRIDIAEKQKQGYQKVEQKISFD